MVKNGIGVELASECEVQTVEEQRSRTLHVRAAIREISFLKETDRASLQEDLVDQEYPAQKVTRTKNSHCYDLSISAEPLEMKTTTPSFVA